MRLSPVLNAPSVCLQGAGETEGKDLRGFFVSRPCSEGGHPIRSEKLTLRHGHKGLKPESVFLFFLFFFWHNM